MTRHTARMARHAYSIRPPTARQTNRVHLYIALFTLSICVLSSVRLRLFKPSFLLFYSRHAESTPPHAIIMSGRWKAVHLALGMPELPDQISQVATQPERDAVSDPPPPPRLHFVPEETIITVSNLSLEEIAISFRAVALFEKEIAAETRRLRMLALGKVPTKTRRRGSSWSIIR